MLTLKMIHLFLKFFFFSLWNVQSATQVQGMTYTNFSFVAYLIFTIKYFLEKYKN
jgi:hypothetical protein